MFNRIRTVLATRRNRSVLYSTSEYWDAKADTYTGSAISMWRNEYLNKHYEREQFDFIARHLPPTLEGKTGLDVGCGTGRVARFLQAHGAQTAGVDFSAASLAVAREIGPASIRYDEGSVLDLSVEAPFDVVVGVGVLTVACQDAPALKAALDKLYSAVKPGGTYIIIEPIHASFLHRVLRMSAAEFAEHLTTAGFEIVSRRELHFWPARLFLAFMPWPRVLTAAGYHMGRGLMGLFGQRLGFGDYRGFCVRRPE